MSSTPALSRWMAFADGDAGPARTATEDTPHAG